MIAILKTFHAIEGNDVHNRPDVLFTMQPGYSFHSPGNEFGVHISDDGTVFKYVRSRNGAVKLRHQKPVQILSGPVGRLP